MAGLGTDAAGNTYVVGSTRSASFSVKSAVQSHSASPGNYDVFVTKLDPAGNIVYSTYFGGGGIDIANAMTVDPAGNVYVTGTTTSTDFPTTSRELFGRASRRPAASREIDFGNFSPGLSLQAERGRIGRLLDLLHFIPNHAERNCRR